MIAALGLVLALASAGTETGRAVGIAAKPDTSRAVATRAKSAGVDTSTARAVATKAVAAGPSDSGTAEPTRALRDTSETHRLPPRTLPLKRQMMFAGGFMVFIALMMTSLQNFNPND